MTTNSYMPISLKNKGFTERIRVFRRALTIVVVVTCFYTTDSEILYYSNLRFQY